jgi:hypothetical protein
LKSRRAPNGNRPVPARHSNPTGSSISALTLERKLAALDAYAAELRDWPHPRSRQGVEHLARWRGATVGVEAAEAFMLARHLGY